MQHVSIVLKWIAVQLFLIHNIERYKHIVVSMFVFHDLVKIFLDGGIQMHLRLLAIHFIINDKLGTRLFFLNIRTVYQEKSINHVLTLNDRYYSTFRFYIMAVMDYKTPLAI